MLASKRFGPHFFDTHFLYNGHNKGRGSSIPPPYRPLRTFLGMVKFWTRRLRASFLCSNSDSGLADQTKLTPPPMPLNPQSRPVRQLSARLFTGQELTNDLVECYRCVSTALLSRAVLRDVSTHTHTLVHKCSSLSRVWIDAHNKDKPCGPTYVYGRQNSL